MIGLIMLINILRTQPLIDNVELNQMAQNRAEYFCTHEFKHEGFQTWFPEGYSYVGENLAKGFKDDFSAQLALTMSPYHYLNMVSPDYQQVGIGKSCGIIVEFFASNKLNVKPSTKGDGNTQTSPQNDSSGRDFSYRK